MSVWKTGRVDLLKCEQLEEFIEEYFVFMKKCEDNKFEINKQQANHC